MNKKQISGGIILSFLSQGISIIVGLLYTPIMMGYLGQSEYGLYQLVLSIANYLNLMNFGFNGAYIRYYSIAKTKNSHEVSNINGMFLTIFICIATLCCIVGTGLYFNINVILGEKLAVADYVIARKLLIIMILNIAISFPNSLYVAYMAANEQFIFSRMTNIICNICIPLLNIPLLVLGRGSVGVVSVTLFITVMRFIVNYTYCKYKIGMKITYGYFDKSIFNDLLKFTFFIFLSDIVDQLNSNVDKLLLGRITGTVAVAIYSVAYNLKNYYTTLTWIVPEMYIPQVNRVVIEEQSDKKTNELFVKIGRINNFIVLLVITGFIIFGKVFVNLWVGSEYELSYYATVILMLSGYIPAVQTLGPNIQTAKNMHQMRSIVYFFVACTNILLSIILIRYYGVIGTCIGTLVAVLAGHGLFMNVYYHKYIKLNVIIFWKEMFKWIIPVIVLCTITQVIIINITITTWLAFFRVAGIYTVLYGLLLYNIGLNKDERCIIKNKMKRFKVINNNYEV